MRTIAGLICELDSVNDAQRGNAAVAIAAAGKKISFQNVDERSLKRKGENVIAARLKM